MGFFVENKEKVTVFSVLSQFYFDYESFGQMESLL